MAYNFNRSNGSTPVTIADGAIDTAQFSVGIVGKNVSGYGETIAKTTVHLLENFAHTAQPSNSIEGQLWYDTANNTIKVYNGASYDKVLTEYSGSVTISTGVDLITGGDIVPDTNNTRDIGTTLLKYANVYATTFRGVATSAQYADVAERYESDMPYTYGTVVKLGGSKEITQTTSANDTDVFGVVSEKPGIMLNDSAGSDATHPYVALTGRVKVKVKGRITKGQRIVSSNTPGVAMYGNDYSPVLAFIGRALETKTTDDVGYVLCAIGAR